jgi:hypothetical protein
MYLQLGSIFSPASPNSHQASFRGTLTMRKSCRIMSISQGCENNVNELLGGLPETVSV